jgi:two-component system chemotaxis response regulator CheB
MRLLIVDDSALYRKILSEAASGLPDVETVTASNGELAIARLKSEPIDLILLDVFMPDRNGPEVLQDIRRENASVPVVMVSGATGRDAEITLSTLSQGAMDFIPKPTAASVESSIATIRSDIRRVVDTVRLRTAQRAFSGQSASANAVTSPTPPKPAPARRLSPPPFLDIVLIGVSTGGPRALGEILPGLAKNFPVPIVIVQHMPPVFTQSLASQLDGTCPLKVMEAPQGHTPVAGEVLIAPGGMHLELVRDPNGLVRTRFSDAPPVHSCRPSVDVLFQTAALCGFRGAVSLILTGMGSDGADGVQTLKDAIPLWSIAQNAATCTVYGMPQAVVQAGLDDECLPLGDIAPRLNRLFQVP